MLMNIILETPRLYLRELTKNDLIDLAEILQDDRVMYAYEYNFTNDDIQNWLNKQLKRYEQYGHGLWAIIKKDTGEFIGQAGLTYQYCDDEKILEVGYLLKYRFWHKGYAREAAKACVNYAFNNLHKNKVSSIIKIDNKNSQKVAVAIGMCKEKIFEAEYYNGKMLHYLFTIKKVEE